MAYIRKRKATWQVQVEKDGIRKSATFDTKAEARTWAAEQESTLKSRHATQNKLLVTALFDKYIKEVCPQHKGQKWERLRLLKLSTGFSNTTVEDLLTTDKLSVWKAKRLLDAAPGTVAREMTLLNQVFEVARREWRMIVVNPMQHIRKPKTPPARHRLISEGEIEKMLAALGSEAGLAFQIALETAMRAGEILGLERTESKVVVLEDTKNGTSRQVPLSKKARELVAKIPEGGFTISGENLSSQFNKARTKCGFPNSKNGGFRFHDSRANALTMLSKKLDVLALAKMVGHNDPRSLMIYYRESAEDIADRL